MLSAHAMKKLTECLAGGRMIPAAINIFGRFFEARMEKNGNAKKSLNQNGNECFFMYSHFVHPLKVLGWDQPTS